MNSSDSIFLLYDILHSIGPMNNQNTNMWMSFGQKPNWEINGKMPNGVVAILQSLIYFGMNT